MNEQLPVQVPREIEGAAFGAALQALWALANARGAPTTFADLVDLHVGFDGALARSPNPEAARRYQEPYGRFREHLVAVQQLYAA